jgi:hypothetical protein
MRRLFIGAMDLRLGVIDGLLVWVVAHVVSSWVGVSR